MWYDGDETALVVTSTHTQVVMRRARMSDRVVCTSDVRVKRVKGLHRRIYLPVTEAPIHVGLQSEFCGN